MTSLPSVSMKEVDNSEAATPETVPTAPVEGEESTQRVECSVVALRRCSKNGCGITDLEQKRECCTLPETLSLEVGRERARQSLQMIHQSMMAAGALQRILPTGLADKDATAKWKEVSKHIQSMQTALSKTRMKDAEVGLKIRSAVKQWEVIGACLRPYCSLPGMRLSPGAVENNMKKLDGICEELQTIFQEIKECMHEQVFDPTALYEMFPADSDVTKENLYREIHKAQSKEQEQRDELEAQEQAMANDVWTHKINKAKEEADLEMVIRDEEELETKKKKNIHAESEIEESVKAVKKRKETAQAEVEKLRHKARMDLQEDQMKRQALQVEARQQQKLFFDEERRNLEKKILGHSGSQARKTDGTHVIFVLDKSGSMSGAPWNTLCSCFDVFLADRKRKGKSDFISVVLFHDQEQCLLTMMALQSNSISLPSNPDSGGTCFSAGFRGAMTQVKAGKGQAGQTVVVFMSDGCSSSGDVQGASMMARKIYQECSGNVVTFGVPLGPHADCPSIERIVKEGNGGLTKKQVGDEQIEMVLPADDIQQLASKFDDIVVFLGSMEQDFLRKLQFLEDEEAKLEEKHRKDIDEMEKSFKQEHASQEARVKNLDSGAEGADAVLKVLNAELKILQDEQLVLKKKQTEIDEKKRDKESLLKGIQGQLDLAESKLQAFEKTKQQKEKDIEKEMKEKEEDVRKKHDYQLKEAEKHFGQLGTMDPVRMHKLRQAVDEFTHAKRELTVQLHNKSMQVSELRENIMTFLDELRSVVGAKGTRFDFSPGGKAGMLENYYDSSFNLGLVQGKDQENFQKIASFALGGDAVKKNGTDLENDAFMLVCSSSIRLEDCVCDGDRDTSTFRQAAKTVYKKGNFDKTIERHVSHKYTVNSCGKELPFDEAEEELETLEKNIEDLKDKAEERIEALKDEGIDVKEEKAAMKAEVDKANKDLMNLKAGVRKQSTKVEKCKEKMQEHVMELLTRLLVALDKPLAIIEEIFAKGEVRKIMIWGEMGFIGTATTYQQVTDGLNKQPPLVLKFEPEDAPQSGRKRKCDF